MKKIYFVLAVLLCAVMVWTVPVGAEDEPPLAPDVTEGEEEPEEPPSTEEDAAPEGEGAKWSMEEIDAYIDGTVIPAVVMVVTALATLYVALMPIINKVKKSSDKFDQASDDITATAGESEQTKKNTKNNSDDGCEVRINHNLLPSCLDISCSLTRLKPELLEHETCKTCCCIQRS